MTNKLAIQAFGLLLFPVLILGFPTAAALAQSSSDVKTIEIHSKWWGLGPTGESSLRIEQHDSEFRIKGKRINKRLVEQLLLEIDAPAEIPTIQNLGITESWLQSNAEA